MIKKSQNFSCFVGFILKDYSYEVHIVNSTGSIFEKVELLRGGVYIDEWDGSCLKTPVDRKEIEQLSPYSTKLIESSDVEELEFSIWYHVNFYSQFDHICKRVSFSLPSFPGLWASYREKSVYIPELEDEGVIILLDSRDDGLSSEEIMHMKKAQEDHSIVKGGQKQKFASRISRFL